MKIQDLKLFIKTLKFLSARQVLYRLYYAAQRKVWPAVSLLRKPTPLSADAPSSLKDLPQELLDLPSHYSSSEDSQKLLSSLRKGQIRVHNKMFPFDGSESSWRLGTQEQDRLSVISLHYHDWLLELSKLAAKGNEGAKSYCISLLSSWLEHCSEADSRTLPLAWNSFAIATRIPNWIKAYALLKDLNVEHNLLSEMLGNLRLQANFLSTHIEWDLRANHLFRNALGLAWAGYFFQQEKWKKDAKSIILSEIKEQILPDGLHFERSPMYHIQIMEDLLSSALLYKDDNTFSTLQAAWKSMAEALRWLRHSDGQITLLNDSAINGAADISAVLKCRKLLGLTLDTSIPKGGHLFSDAGLFTWHNNDWDIFFDIGPLGPDYQPGHGHADTLTIEASFQGKRLFVDPGTYNYDQSDKRNYDRGTRSHNTVSIDKENSSEVWKIFRVGKRAKPLISTSNISDSGFQISASHDGYSRLSGSPIHLRSMTFEEDGVLCIDDEVKGSGKHLVETAFLLGPGWNLHFNENVAFISDSSRKVAVEFSSDKKISIGMESSTYHPEFGSEVFVPRIRWSYEGDLPIKVSATVHFHG